jgi:hypothetical protein
MIGVRWSYNPSSPTKEEQLVIADCMNHTAAAAWETWQVNWNIDMGAKRLMTEGQVTCRDCLGNCRLLSSVEIPSSPGAFMACL